MTGVRAICEQLGSPGVMGGIQGVVDIEADRAVSSRGGEEVSKMGRASKPLSDGNVSKMQRKHRSCQSRDGNIFSKNGCRIVMNGNMHMW